MRLALLAALLFVASAFVLPPAHAATPSVTSNTITGVTLTPSYSQVTVRPSSCGGTCPYGGAVVLKVATTCSLACSSLTYSWVLTDTQIGFLNTTSASQVAFTALATSPAKEQVTVGVTSGIQTVYAYGVIEIVSHLMTGASISPSSVSIDAGGSEILTITPVCDGGCLGAISYSWKINSGNKTGYIGGTGVNWGDVHANSTAGNISVLTEAMQPAGQAYEGSPAVISYGRAIVQVVALLPVQFYDTNAQLGFGTTNISQGGNLSVFENYTSTVCGTCEVRFSMTSGPIGCSTLNITATTHETQDGYCRPTTPGTYHVNLTIAYGSIGLSSGFSVGSYYVTATNLTVFYSMTVNIRATPNPVVIHNSTLFTEILNSSYGPVSLGPNATFAWSGLPTGCVANKTIAAFTCLPLVVGTFQVDLTVRGIGTAGNTGAVQWYGNDPYAVTVVGTSGGANLALSASPVQLQPGGTVTYWVNTTDTLKLYWAGLPSGCVGPNKTVAIAGGAVTSTSFSCIYSTAGTYVTNLSATYCPSNACTTILRQIQIQVGAITPGTPGGNGSGGGNGTGGGVSLPTVAAPIVDWTLYFLIFVMVAVFAFFVLRWATSSSRHGQR